MRRRDEPAKETSRLYPFWSILMEQNYDDEFAQILRLLRDILKEIKEARNEIRQIPDQLERRRYRQQ